MQELTIELREKDIHFTSFGVDTKYSQWGILGYAFVDESYEKIYKRWQAHAKERFENENIFPVRFLPKEVIKYIYETDPWAPSALACIYHTLRKIYGSSAVDLAFRNAGKVKRKKSDNKNRIGYKLTRLPYPVWSQSTTTL